MKHRQRFEHQNLTKEDKPKARKHLKKCSTSLSPSVHFSSVTQSCPTLCGPMNCNMPGLPVHHQLLESTQTHAHRVGGCHPTILSSVVPFSSCPQSFPTSGSFPMSQLFASKTDFLYQKTFNRFSQQHYFYIHTHKSEGLSTNRRMTSYALLM